jgi:hypothetical protein
MGKKYLTRMRILIILSGIGLIIGSILPWDIFSSIQSFQNYTFRNTYYKPGYLCGGLYTEMIGLFILLIYFLLNEKRDRYLSASTTVFGVLTGVIVVHHFITVHPVSYKALPNAWISIGPGYFIVFISSLSLAILGGINTTHRSRLGVSPRHRIGLFIFLILVYLATNFMAGVAYMVGRTADSYSVAAAIAKSEIPHNSTDKSLVQNLVSHTDLIWIGLPISINWINLGNYQYHYFDPKGDGIYMTNNSPDGYFCWVLEDMGPYYQLRGPFTLC